MGLFDKAIDRFLAAYREGLVMSCPVHRTGQKAVKHMAKRHEQIRTAVNQRKSAKAEKRTAR